MKQHELQCRTQGKQTHLVCRIVSSLWTKVCEDKQDDEAGGAGTSEARDGENVGSPSVIVGCKEMVKTSQVPMCKWKNLTLKHQRRRRDPILYLSERMLVRLQVDKGKQACRRCHVVQSGARLTGYPTNHIKEDLSITTGALLSLTRSLLPYRQQRS